MHRSNALNPPTQRSIARREDEYTVPEVASLLEVSVRYAWYLVSRNELPSYKRLGRRLVKDVDLKAYVKRLGQQEQQARTATRHEFGVSA